MSPLLVPATPIQAALTLTGSPFHHLQTCRGPIERHAQRCPRPNAVCGCPTLCSCSAGKPSAHSCPCSYPRRAAHRPGTGACAGSYYRWLPPDDLLSSADLSGLDEFDLLLRLFDFSPWRPYFARRFKSALGPPPFDPLSLGLAHFLARYQEWDWARLCDELTFARERGLGYCRRLGFDPTDLPVRYHLRMAPVNFRPIISHMISPKVYHPFSPKCYQ